jgi:hypothetical protein
MASYPRQNRLPLHVEQKLCSHSLQYVTSLSLEHRQHLYELIVEDHRTFF